jgi:hypothetical protein
MYVILLAIMIFVSATLAGLAASPFPKRNPADQVPSWYHCCDLGDGDNCKPITDQKFTFNKHTYALLKSDIYPIRGDEQYDHFERADKVGDLGWVYINSANDHDNHDRSADCRFANRNKEDWIRSGPDGAEEGSCTGIPKKTLVYLCRPDKNPSGLCGGKELKTPAVTLDVYLKINDNGTYSIPNAVKNCNKPPMPSATEPKIEFRPSPSGQPNLQLRTFKFIEDVPHIRWLSPFCKPAVYLYPERKTSINVSVFPQGKMLLTIPQYPKNGWDVVADPNGNISYQNERFDYLYYEASLPDELITPPAEGFVMRYDERALFLTDLVTKLGLNEKETKQFVDYWVPILPKSPYYFVGIMPSETLNELSPLLITPKPKNLIRVTLYFKPLEKSIPVSHPLLLPVTRDGYTAVEWGGIFKQDKSHPFSCFM